MFCQLRYFLYRSGVVQVILVLYFYHGIQFVCVACVAEGVAIPRVCFCIQNIRPEPEMHSSIAFCTFFFRFPAFGNRTFSKPQFASLSVAAGVLPGRTRVWITTDCCIFTTSTVRQLVGPILKMSPAPNPVQSRGDMVIRLTMKAKHFTVGWRATTEVVTPVFLTFLP